MDRHSLPAVGRHTVVHAVGRHSSLPAIGRYKKNVMILYSEHVTAPSSTNCERLSTPSGRKSVLHVRACTEPAGTGFGDVCFERGGEKWAKKSHTPTHTHHTHKYRNTQNKAPYPRIRTAVKRLSFSCVQNTTKEKKSSFTYAPRQSITRRASEAGLFFFGCLFIEARARG